MRGPVRVALLAAAMVSATAVASAAAQDDASITRLSTALDSSTRVAVLAMVDSARVARLPSMALVNKALEGAGKHASGPGIVAAVRALSGELRGARGALGQASRPDEITAGAHALHSGIRPAALSRLRHAAVGRELTTPLTVLTDLVARGVPPATAEDAVVSLTQGGLRDAEFDSFQRAVSRDIASGADPASATTIRAKGALLGHGGYGTGGGRG